MTTTQHQAAPGKALGYGGVVLAIAGAAWLAWLSNSGLAAFGMITPLVAAAVLMTIPATRENSIIWLLAGAWSGFLAALTFFSIGVIFLIATVLLLAAFLRANWTGRA